MIIQNQRANHLSNMEDEIKRAKEDWVDALEAKALADIEKEKAWEWYFTCDRRVKEAYDRYHKLIKNND